MALHAAIVVSVCPGLGDYVEIAAHGCVCASLGSVEGCLRDFCVLFYNHPTSVHKTVKTSN